MQRSQVLIYVICVGAVDSEAIVVASTITLDSALVQWDTGTSSVFVLENVIAA